MRSGIVRTGVLFVVITMVMSDVAAAGTIVIISRESYGRNNLLAGSGGALRQSQVSDSTDALTGPFSFGDSASVEVTEDMPFSTGAADAFGSLTAADNVVQTAANSLTLTATRSASGTANVYSGPANATSNQDQRLGVRFEVVDFPVEYRLTGTFDPGVDDPVEAIKLRRPFTSQVLFAIDEAGPVDESGTLVPGRVYLFEVRINDRIAASAGTPADADASSFDLLFTVAPIESTGDCDGDEDVDLEDFVAFEACLGGPEEPYDAGCECSDLDQDGDVDLKDYAGLQINFTGG